MHDWKIEASEVGALVGGVVSSVVGISVIIIIILGIIFIKHKQKGK